jgi:hypothetical protein
LTCPNGGPAGLFEFREARVSSPVQDAFDVDRFGLDAVEDRVLTNQPSAIAPRQVLTRRTDCGILAQLVEGAIKIGLIAPCLFLTPLGQAVEKDVRVVQRCAG